MSHLELLVPFALPPAELSADLLKQLHAPALAMLAARARSERAAGRSETIDEYSRALPHEIWLSRRFGLEAERKHGGSPPIATALMQAFGLPVSPGTWFVLEPVHIHIARDHLVLSDPRQLMMSEQDARALFDIAKPLFDEAGKQLLYGSANTWFVRADDWSALQTSSPDTTAGHNIDIWMPKGSGERDWRKLQNEVQMHWFNHPVNEAREARLQKAVNSIWLWGGSAGQPATQPQGATATFNLEGWMRAFGQFAGSHGHANSAADLLQHKPAQGLAVLDALLEPALSSDWARWLAAMQELEAGWFAPLLAGLQSGAVDQLTLVATHDTRISRFSVTRSSLRKFWIKPTLSALVS